jgi:hypothetical protein
MASALFHAAAALGCGLAAGWLVLGSLPIPAVAGVVLGSFLVFVAHRSETPND